MISPLSTGISYYHCHEHFLLSFPFIIRSVILSVGMFLKAAQIFLGHRFCFFLWKKYWGTLRSDGVHSKSVIDSGKWLQLKCYLAPFSGTFFYNQSHSTFYPIYYSTSGLGAEFWGYKINVLPYQNCVSSKNPKNCTFVKIKTIYLDLLRCYIAQLPDKRDGFFRSIAVWQPRNVVWQPAWIRWLYKGVRVEGGGVRKEYMQKVYIYILKYFCRHFASLFNTFWPLSAVGAGFNW